METDRPNGESADSPLEPPAPQQQVKGAYPLAAVPPWRKRKTVLTVAAPGALLLAGLGVAIALSVARGPGDASGQGPPEPGVGDEGEPPMDPVDLAVADVDTSDLPAPRPLDASPEDDEAEEGDAGAAAGSLISIEEADAGALSQSGDVVVHEGHIGEGFTVLKRLTGHGLSSRDAHAVVNALEKLYDFRRSRPSHAYRLELSRGGGEVVRFRYQAGLTDIYEVRRDGEEYVGRKIRVPTDLRRVRAGLMVRGTLSESIAARGLKSQVLSAFLRAFDSDVNFQGDLREGDSLKVVLDEESLEGRFLGYKTIWAMEYVGAEVGRRRAFFFRTEDGRGRFYDEEGRSTERSVLRTPLRYTRITSPFDPARMHPILRRRVPHNGVDFAAPSGTPVWATADGVVSFVGSKGAAGNLVIVQHDGGLESIYAHLKGYARGLKRGDEVRQRQVIGYVGSTGRSTGPHLHFGLRKGGRFIDPLSMKSRPGPLIDKQYRAAFRAHERELVSELAATPIAGR